MTSIYRRALGRDFDRLHPEIQRRFGFSSEDHLASVGTGVMEKVERGPFWTIPFLWLGSWRRILLPRGGRNVPFRIENFAYRDRYGRETVTWLRTFEIAGKPHRFDAYMIHSDQRKRIVDYLGTHQHLAVDIELSVNYAGGLVLRSGEQRFYEGPVAFRFPLLFSGIAEVCEWYDDETRQFRIEVEVRNRIWGRLFRYRGSFQVEWHELDPAAVPPEARPRREERRE